jgi:hypothetical protein
MRSIRTSPLIVKPCIPKIRAQFVSSVDRNERCAKGRGGGEGGLLTLDAPNLPMVRGPKRESHGHEDFDQTSWNRRRVIRKTSEWADIDLITSRRNASRVFFLVDCRFLVPKYRVVKQLLRVHRKQRVRIVMVRVLCEGGGSS